MEINQTSSEFFAQGKLLLAGEYFVLDGAVALAFPTKKGQYLKVKPVDSKALVLTWKSYDHNAQLWFEGSFDLQNLNVVSSSDEDTSARIIQILSYIKEQRSDLFTHAFEITTHLEFDRQWGLGTSSTLLANLANWAEIDPYQLAAATFGGSGYDLACAAATGPIFYQNNTVPPTAKALSFQPSFVDQLFLVYLGKKQNSREGIRKYKSQGEVDPGLIRQISQLSMMLGKAADLSTFCACVQELERLTGDYVQLVPLQEVLFAGIPGAIKSLGAWGGDFALIATPWEFEKVKDFCGNLGLEEVYRFSEIIL